MAAAAHVITVGLGHHLNQNIRAWFRQFNFLPPIPLSAATVDTVLLHDASFAKLLRLMFASPHRNFILIIHGHEDGSGLFLKLEPSQVHPHTLHFDLQRLMGLDDGGPELSRRDQATMGISQRESHQVLDLMHKVRDKRIDCIEFRSCNLGRNKLSLDRFRRFFGARQAGAPNIHTLFGLVPVLTGPHSKQTHKHHHPGGNWETYIFPKWMDEPKLVCCFQLNKLSKPESGGHVVADNADTLNAWIKKFVMPHWQPFWRRNSDARTVGRGHQSHFRRPACKAQVRSRFHRIRFGRFQRPARRMGWSSPAPIHSTVGRKLREAYYLLAVVRLKAARRSSVF
jgi:hypothetical protein